MSSGLLNALCIQTKPVLKIVTLRENLRVTGVKNFCRQWISLRRHSVYIFFLSLVRYVYCLSLLFKVSRYVFQYFFPLSVMYIYLLLLPWFLPLVSHYVFLYIFFSLLRILFLFQAFHCYKVSHYVFLFHHIPTFFSGFISYFCIFLKFISCSHFSLIFCRHKISHYVFPHFFFTPLQTNIHFLVHYVYRLFFPNLQLSAFLCIISSLRIDSFPLNSLRI